MVRLLGTPRPPLGEIFPNTRSRVVRARVHGISKFRGFTNSWIHTRVVYRIFSSTKRRYRAVEGVAGRTWLKQIPTFLQAKAAVTTQTNATNDSFTD